MKRILAILILLIPFQLAAQKETLEVIDAAGLAKIFVEGDEIYKLSIRTAPDNQIRIWTRADGEYYDEIDLDTEIRGGSLFLESRFMEILQSGYDKLSAHKVFAIEVELEIPEGMQIDINSNLASVYMSGNYREVLIQSKTGSSYLKDFVGDAVINTYDGNIEVTTSNANVEANSRHGEVIVPQQMSGSNKIILTSINGNIMVQETK